MAELILGVGTSHSPMLSIPGQHWLEYAEKDRTKEDLIYPPDGALLSYDEAVARSATLLKDKPMTAEAHLEQYQRCRAAISALADDFSRLAPDIVVMISDDQEEWFYESNMPVFSIFWGSSVRMLPRPAMREMAPELEAAVVAGYGDVVMDMPVASDLGEHLVSYLTDHDFDVAHSTYLTEQYGGRVTRRYPGPAGVVELPRERRSRRLGLPHGFSFVVKNLLGNQPRAIVPISQNTCYPPNAVSPRRSLAFGQAVGQAIAEWDSDCTVALVASGGLSHFVTDEELDRQLLDAIEQGDLDTLSHLPRRRLYSGTSESLNWVAVAGALASSGLKFSTVDYVPVYRSAAGTGGGWAFGHWI